MSRYTGWAKVTGDRSREALGRKVLGELMDGVRLGGLGQNKLRKVFADGTVVIASFDGTTPRVDISAPGGGGEEDECIGLTGHLSKPRTIASWPTVTPRDGIAPHKLTYFNMVASYDRIYFWGNQATVVDGEQKPGPVYAYDYPSNTVTRTTHRSSSGGFMPGIPVEARKGSRSKGWAPNQYTFQSGASPAPDLSDDVATPFYPLAQQSTTLYNLVENEISAEYLSRAGLGSPSQLNRVYGSSVGRMAFPGLNINGALAHDDSILLPRACLGLSSDGATTPNIFIVYKMRSVHAHGIDAYTLTPTFGGGISGPEGPLYPTVCAMYKDRVDLYGFMPTRPPDTAHRRAVEPVLGQLSSFVPTSDMIRAVAVIDRDGSGTPIRDHTTGTFGTMKPAFASQFATTAQVCASVVTAGVWNAAGDMSGDVYLHQIGFPEMHLVGHIPELDNIYVNGIARAVPLHDRVLVFVPVAHSEQSGDTTPHPMTMVDEMRVYEVT